jgi:hypothetical protein
VHKQFVPLGETVVTNLYCDVLRWLGKTSSETIPRPCLWKCVSPHITPCPPAFDLKKKRQSSPPSLIIRPHMIFLLFPNEIEAQGVTFLNTLYKSGPNHRTWWRRWRCFWL